MNIKVVPYNPKWPEAFQVEKAHVVAIVSDNLTNVFHIGSTAVPNLASKPIIDMLLVVESLEVLDTCNQEFEALGYECMHEFGIKGRRYYRKGGDDRTHQIHAFHYSNLYEIERHLIFRDYLRSHPKVCTAYGTLKSELALLHPKDIDAYGDGKEAFVKRVECDALRWHIQNIA